MNVAEAGPAACKSRAALNVHNDTLVSEMGYLHTFIDATTYSFNASTGEFEETVSGGRAHAMAPIITLGAGFDFSQNFGVPAAVYVRYQAFFELSYWPEQGSLFMSHTALYLGVLIKIGRVSQ